MTPLVPDDNESTDLDADLRAYAAACRQVTVAEEVLEWMKWRAIDSLMRSHVSDPKEIAQRLGIKRTEVIKWMMPPVQARFYSQRLSEDAQLWVDEILRESAAGE